MFGYDTIRVIERSILRQTVYKGKGAGGVDAEKLEQLGFLDDDEPRPTYATSYAYLLHCVVTTAVKGQEYCQIPEDELHEEIMEDMYYLLSP
jgi:hypothetical protein